MKRRAAQAGFTLIEIVLSITILGLVAVTTGFLIYQGTRSYETLGNQKEVSQQGALAMERLSRELRLMKCTVSGNSCKPSASDLPSMTGAEVRFVNTNLEGRGFRLSGQNLLLRNGSGAGDPEYALADNLSSLTFEYLKSNGTTAAVPGDVWMIRVEMMLASGAESIPLRATVHPRSLR